MVNEKMKKKTGKILITIGMICLALLLVMNIVNSDIFQPDATEGIDTFANQNVPNNNYGTQTFLAAGESSGNYAGILIKFTDVDNIPSSANITSAILKLYFYDSPTNPTNAINLSTRLITENWSEDTVTWNTKPSYSSNYSDKVTLTNSYGWIEWDVTDGVQRWVNGSSINYGLAVIPDQEIANTDKRFYSSDHTEASLRPILEVNYIIDVPNITLVWPENDTQHGDGDVWIGYRVESSENIANCSLIYNNTVYGTDNSIQTGVLQRHKLIVNNNNFFIWQINCTTDSGIVGSSEKYHLITNTSKADFYGWVENANGNRINITIDFAQGGVTKFNSNGKIHALVLDDGIYNITVSPINHPFKNITFKNINIQKGFTKIVDVDMLTGTELYALDPTQFNFSEATVTSDPAKGAILYKCKDWNFSAQNCTGNWTKVKDLVLGQEYSFALTPEDPGFIESNLTSAVHAGSDVLSYVIAKDNNWYLADMKDASKRFYLNFSSNLTNGSILNMFVKKNKGVTIGIYAYSDTTGANPFGTFTVTSATGAWSNITLNISTPTHAIWLGEGTGSGSDPKEEFDYIIASILTGDAPPTTTLNTPVDNYYNDTSDPVNITFNCSATDDIQLVNISLYITNSTNQSFSLNQTTNISGISNSSQWILELVNGNYTWNCLTYDNASQGDWDINRSLKINYSAPVDNAPNVTLDYPVDNYYDDTNQYVNITFNATVTDDYNLVNCSLWHNYTGTWHLNQTQAVSGTSNTTEFNLTQLTNKTFVWNIECYDNASQSAFDSTNRTVILNWTAPPDNAPQITLNLPGNNTQFNNTQNINFNFTATDDQNSSLECSIYLDSVLNQTNSSTQNNTLTNFLINGITYGSHNWSVNCSDGSLSNVSEVRYFSINDTQNPTYSNDQDDSSGSVVEGIIVNISVLWQDNVVLDTAIFRTNQTGSWINVSTCPLTGTSQWCNKTIDTTGDAGKTICWNEYANDTADNLNTSMSQTTHCFNVTAIPVDNPPTTTLVSPADASSDTDGNIVFTCNATDDLQLSNITFYWNYSGSWQENGTVTVSGTDNETNFVRNGLSDGTILWNCQACDNASQCDFANTNWSVDVDTTKPVITFVNPTPGNDSTVTVNYVYVNITSNENLDIAILEWNGSNESMSGSGTNWYKNKTGLSNSLYIYKVYGNDSAGNWNVSETRHVTVNVTGPIPPTVILNSPQNNAVLSSTSITFNCTAYDDLNLTNITLYGNWSGWHANETNSSPKNNTATLFVKNLGEGIYLWNCEACDNASLCSFDANRTLIIDITPPVITNVNAISITHNSAIIIWDTDEASNSSVSYDTSTKDSSNLVTSHSITLSGLSPDTLYDYNVTSCDAAGNCNTDGPYNFTTSSAPPGGGGGGGGGGAGGTGAPKQFPEEKGREYCDMTPDLNRFNRANCSAGVLDIIYFQYKNVQHKITISKFNLIVSQIGPDSVEIIIESEPIYDTFLVNETKEFDLDNDGINDISVTLDDIDRLDANYPKAIVTMLLLEEIPECVCLECGLWSDCIEGKQTRTCYKCGEETNYECQEHTEEKSCMRYPRIRWWWILIPVLAIILIIIAIKSGKQKPNLKLDIGDYIKMRRKIKHDIGGIKIKKIKKLSRKEQEKIQEEEDEILKDARKIIEDVEDTKLKTPLPVKEEKIFKEVVRFEKVGKKSKEDLLKELKEAYNL